MSTYEIFKRYPRPWQFRWAGAHIFHERKDKRLWSAEDFCIVDRDNYEVLGVDSYLRCHPDVVKLMIEAINVMK